MNFCLSSLGDHSVVLTEDGKVYIWGDNQYGQLGNGEKRDLAVPILVESLSHEVVIGIAVGGWHTLALTNNGAVYSWGRNKEGQLGHGELSECLSIPKKFQI